MWISFTINRFDFRIYTTLFVHILLFFLYVGAMIFALFNQFLFRYEFWGLHWTDSEYAPKTFIFVSFTFGINHPICKIYAFSCQFMNWTTEVVQRSFNKKKKCQTFILPQPADVANKKKTTYLNNTGWKTSTHLLFRPLSMDKRN